MLDELKYKFAKFMQGRYGVDSLSRFIAVVMLILIVLNWFVRIPFCNIITMAALIVLYFRMFSRNIQKRYAENQKFLQFRDRVYNFFANFKSNVAQAKDYHIYKCPHCNQKIRIPRGKGHIMVRCPRCGYEFAKNS
jgi:uncharacterized paraquat-inducible protein A